MSAREAVKPTNIMFVILGIYFAAIPGLAQGSIYSLVGTLLCFIAAALDLRKNLFISKPWRVATSAFVLAMLVAQLIASANSNEPYTLVVVGSVVLNVILFVIFLGVLLSTTRGLVKKPEDEKADVAESKKVMITA
ncbi:MAG: hypothetical protein ACREBS_07135 [Nitrososphaerales archaeon]